jgi:hypothetical protein
MTTPQACWGVRATTGEGQRAFAFKARDCAFCQRGPCGLQLATSIGASAAIASSRTA